MAYTRLVPAGSGFEIAAEHALQASERQALKGRLADLRVAMAPADRRTIQALVGSLLAGYPSGRAHRDEADEVLKMFVQGLGGMPAWAISAACSAWNRGEVRGKNTTFAPSPSDLRAAAMEIATPFISEQKKIGLILAAEVVPERESDERRKEVADRVRAFAATLGQPEEPVAKPKDRTPEEIAADIRALGTPSTPLSPGKQEKAA